MRRTYILGEYIMRNRTKTIQFFLVTIWLCIVTSAINASGFEGDKKDQIDFDYWSCESCPEAKPWDFTLTTSLGYLDNQSYPFEHFSGIEDGTALFFSGSLSIKKEDGFYWDTDFHNLGIDSVGLNTELGKQGDYSLSLNYQDIPIRDYAYMWTPFANPGATDLTLNSNWLTSSSALDFANRGLYSPFSLKQDWSRLGLQFKMQTEHNMSYQIGFKRLEKSGFEEFSLGQMLTASYIPLPVNNVTENFNAGINWYNDSWYISVNGMVSRFNNALESINVQYPFTTLVPGSEFSETATDPDNTMRRFSVNASYTLAPGSTARLRYSQSVTEQNAALLDYSTNPLFQTPLPVMSFDGEIDTTDLYLQFNHRFNSDWSFKASYRDRDRENNSQIYNWQPVITDLYTGLMVSNMPYDRSKQRFELWLKYRLSSNHKFTLKFHDQKQVRNFQQYVSNQDLGMTFGYRGVFDKWFVSASLEGIERDDSGISLLDYFDANENPLLQRYNVAKRDQGKARIHTAYSFNENFGIAFSASSLVQDYHDTEIGLTDNDRLSLGLDLNWRINETADMAFYYQNEALESQLAGSNTASNPDWFATTTDDVDSYGVSLNLFEMFETQANLRLNIQRSESDTAVNYQVVLNNSMVPDVTSEWTEAELVFNYPYSDKLDIAIKYQYQDFDSNDYTLDQALPGNLSRVLSMGAMSQRDQVNYIALSFTYRFGETSTSEEDDDEFDMEEL